MSQLWDLVVPVKALHLAKSRMLSLSGEARSRLMFAMVTDTLVAMTSSASVRRVYLVTSDPEVISLAARLRATVMADPGRGLNAAIRCGVRRVRADRSDAAVAAMTADLPALTADVLDRALLGAAQVHSAFVLDASGAGTTLLSAAPRVTLDPRFGPASGRRHEARGAVPLDAPGLERLRQDVDTEADLEAARLLGLGEATSRYAIDARRSSARRPQRPQRAGARTGCLPRAERLVAER